MNLFEFFHLDEMARTRSDGLMGVLHTMKKNPEKQFTIKDMFSIYTHYGNISNDRGITNAGGQSKSDGGDNIQSFWTLIGRLYNRAKEECTPSRPIYLAHQGSRGPGNPSIFKWGLAPGIDFTEIEIKQQPGTGKRRGRPPGAKNKPRDGDGTGWTPQKLPDAPASSSSTQVPDTIKKTPLPSIAASQDDGDDEVDDDDIDSDSDEDEDDDFGPRKSQVQKSGPKVNDDDAAALEDAIGEYKAEAALDRWDDMAKKPGDVMSAITRDIDKSIPKEHQYLAMKIAMTIVMSK